MDKGAKWLVGIAAVLVVGGIINAVDGDKPADDAAAAPLAVTTEQAVTSAPLVDLPTSSTATPSTTVSSSSSAAAAETTDSPPAADLPLPTTSESAPVVVETTLAAPAKVEQVAAASSANGAVTLLATLAIKGRAPKTGYDRALFGQSWTDDVTVDGGHNGCDTRNDILRRDLTSIGLKPGSNGCTVLTGILADPYTGKTIDFVRGEDTSSAVQIDHLVAMSDAWQKGAQQLSADQRKNFANDPLNLQATDGPTNSSKGAGDAATWLPPNGKYRCTYVSRQVQVKARYGLWVTQAEHDAILRVLAKCGATVPASSSVPPPAKPTTSKAAPSKTSAAPPAKSTSAVPLVAPKTSAAPPPVKPAGCHPTSPSGNCYKAGQFCAKKHHGISGIDESGRTITCSPSGDRWKWVA